MIPLASIAPARTKRRQRQRCGGDVATGGGDKRGAGDRRPEQLRQPEGGLSEQLGMGMLRAVPLRVQRRVAQAEVGGQIDHMGDVAEQFGDKPGGLAVGQGAEDKIEAVGRAGLRNARRSNWDSRPPHSGTGRPPGSPPWVSAVA